MGLGYEGWVKLDDTFALGTGTGVPRTRSRLESSAGYGGQIESPPNEIGIGAPYNHDWEIHDGNVNFEMTQGFFDELVDWLFHRQTAKAVLFSSRKSNVQQYDSAFWSSIDISAAEQVAVDGSFSFVALDRTDYEYGVEYPTNKTGNSADGSDYTNLCPRGDFPWPLNEGDNTAPVPSWNTRVQIASTPRNFITWSLSFAQPVVKFFACEYNTSAQPPKYLAVGPMTVTFGGSFMLEGGFFGDAIDQLDVYIGASGISLKRLIVNFESDNVQSPGSVVPLEVEYSAYEIAAA